MNKIYAFPISTRYYIHVKHICILYNSELFKSFDEYIDLCACKEYLHEYPWFFDVLMMCRTRTEYGYHWAGFPFIQTPIVKCLHRPYVPLLSPYVHGYDLVHIRHVNSEHHCTTISLTLASLDRFHLTLTIGIITSFGLMLPWSKKTKFLI